MQFLKSLFGGAATASTHLTAAEAKARLAEDKSVFVLDVRQPDEFRGGHIGGAHLIPLNELPARLNEIPQDRPVLCVCRSGSRSSAAMGQLRRAGCDALNLRGGMLAWQMAGFPVRKGK